MKVNGTSEWSVKTVNCCTGCSHDCRYCYAKGMAIRFRQVTAEQWPLERIRTKDVIKTHKKYKGQVMFPSYHDITPNNLNACMTVLENLLVAGNRVLIVSKPHLDCIKAICERFDQFKEKILFRFTITARDQEILAFWEPGAPGYDQRRESLELAAERGFATSVSIEPMLDVDDIFGLVEDLSPWVSHSIWVGLMNKISERVTADSPIARQEVARIEAGQTHEKIHYIYGRLKNNPLLRWKESIKKIVGLPESALPGLDI